MGHYVESSAYEAEKIAERIAADEIGFGIALHRIAVITGEFTADGSTLVKEMTNDNNDDGYPDGEWEIWSSVFTNEDTALAYAGFCRVGVSGVIVTVTVDGKERRQ